MPETQKENQNLQNTENMTEPIEPQEIEFEGWLDTQDELVRDAYKKHLNGLLNTVKTTRSERDELNRQLKELLPKAEKGSEAEKLLTEFSTKLEQAEQRAAFAEEAIKPEIGCSNPKAAYALAVAEKLFDSRGRPDWISIKEAAPELFQKPLTQKTNAGNGTGAEPSNKIDMNTFIRQSAGRS